MIWTVEMETSKLTKGCMQVWPESKDQDIQAAEGWSKQARPRHPGCQRFVSVVWAGKTKTSRLPKVDKCGLSRQDRDIQAAEGLQVWSEKPKPRHPGCRCFVSVVWAGKTETSRRPKVCKCSLSRQDRDIHHSAITLHQPYLPVTQNPTEIGCIQVLSFFIVKMLLKLVL